MVVVNGGGDGRFSVRGVSGFRSHPGERVLGAFLCSPTCCMRRMRPAARCSTCWPSSAGAQGCCADASLA